MTVQKWGERNGPPGQRLQQNMHQLLAGRHEHHRIVREDCSAEDRHAHDSREL